MSALLVESQRDFFRQQRDRYRHGCPTYAFNDGRYSAMRDLALELRESNGLGLDETAAPCPSRYANAE